HTFSVGREQCFQQVETLTKSHSLHSSESLCKLLRYLAEHSLDHPGIALKEYQIATEVLGRPTGFDPQSDSTVRVQAGRLRVKLSEYYSQETIDDPIVVELPKGSYALTFHLRTPKGGLQPATPSLIVEPEAVKRSHRAWTRSSTILVVILSVLLAGSLITTVVLLSSRARNQAASTQPIPTEYQIFWNRF